MLTPKKKIAPALPPPAAEFTPPSKEEEMKPPKEKPITIPGHVFKKGEIIYTRHARMPVYSKPNPKLTKKNFRGYIDEYSYIGTYVRKSSVHGWSKVHLIVISKLSPSAVKNRNGKVIEPLVRGNMFVKTNWITNKKP